ncbi:hypothetical protein LKF67_2527 [Lactococcus lactis subsp. lactis]|uniref:hypothetical protein n=1 Tax=Lactococcus lactis TaxID=1358 RepID=UPI00072822EF|nr:hypothetical protein [Lactococcus lactis]KST88013.1 hypothetical protein LKF67_2527 [Lactococcus lactis subsp. lactis]
MNQEDPILKKIREKQTKIADETQLVKKKYSVNLLVLGTSLLLFIGILVGVIRILMTL